MTQYDMVLGKLGLRLPALRSPIANFAPYKIAGKLVYISGQIPVQDGQIAFVGKLGQEFSVEQGKDAARLCALHVLATIHQACDGDLDRVAQCIRLGGFINCTPDFANQPEVVNGASDLLVAVLGDRGRHARAAVGVNSLPRNVAVELDAIFEIV